jgi:dolichyl-phosphate-mannose--protein O-mannosyl transferase
LGNDSVVSEAARARAGRSSDGLGLPLVLAIVLTALAALWLVDLSGPPVEGAGYVHDECYQAFTAHRYALDDPDAWRYGDRATVEKLRKDDLTANTTYEWVHPPFAKLVMSWFIRAFGFTPTVYRLGSVLMGVLAAAGMMALAHRLYGARVALIAGVLLAFDGLFFSMSRIAMNDVYVAAPCAWLVYATARASTSRQRIEAWTALAGACAGVAIATKWNAAPLCILGALLTLGAAWTSAHRARAVAAWVASFALLPLAIYLASYAPFFRLGNGLDELAALTKQIIDFHRSLRAGHSSSSHWYEWPLAIRPVWLYQADGPTADTVRNMYLFPNPILWWGLFGAVIYVAVRSIRARAVHEVFVWLPFAAAWLPWSVIGRVTFIQYLMPGLVFGVLALAVVLDELARRSPGWSRAARVYVVVAALAFGNLYPMLTGTPEPRAQVSSPRWFWIPIWRPR